MVNILNIQYKSTRSDDTVTASQAILKGLANDGGLFVPTSIPKLQVSLSELSKMSYKETAYAVMKEFLTDFTEEELKNCIDKAYDSKFDTEEIAPLVKAEDAYYLELFHGSTIAFKDMALSILPHLLTTSAKKNNVKNDIVILTATSGDTGKAALSAAFCAVYTEELQPCGAGSQRYGQVSCVQRAFALFYSDEQRHNDRVQHVLQYVLAQSGTRRQLGLHRF